MTAYGKEEWTLWFGQRQNNGERTVADVYISRAALKEWAKAGSKGKAEITATLRKQYIRYGSENIPATRLNKNERTHRVGHKSVKLQAFKGWQVRAYGVEGSVSGKRAFFVSAIDGAKKQQRADNKTLKRAAPLAVRLADLIPGGTVFKGGKDD